MKALLRKCPARPRTRSVRRHDRDDSHDDSRHDDGSEGESKSFDGVKSEKAEEEQEVPFGPCGIKFHRGAGRATAFSGTQHSQHEHHREALPDSNGILKNLIRPELSIGGMFGVVYCTSP
jgi:hypothetical protein